MLRKSVKRAQTIALVAGVGVVVAIVAVVLVVTGVFGSDEEEPAPTVSEIIAAVKPSTLQVRGADDDGDTVGLGTGWVLDAANGLIVTNAHVTNEATRFTVRVGDETKERDADIVGVAPCEDLAVLKVENKTGLETMALGSQAALEQGDSVIALGYPTTLAATDDLIATTGVISVVKTRVTLGGQRYRNVLQSDAVINPGNSGGPLVDLDQQLVGVNTLKTVAEGVEGQFYAIGVDRVKLITQTLRKGDSIGWNGMGFAYADSVETLEENDFPAIPGIVVVRAAPDTEAADAGFGGDTPALITAIDGKALDLTLGSWCTAVGEFEKGETAVFTVYVQGDTESQDIEVAFE
jgi:S1-C subfamily serine protease